MDQEESTILSVLRIVLGFQLKTTFLTFQTFNLMTSWLKLKPLSW